MRILPKRCHADMDLHYDCLGCIAMAILYTERAIKKAAKGSHVRDEIAMSQEIQGLYFLFDGLCQFCGGTSEQCPDYECQKEYDEFPSLQ